MKQAFFELEEDWIIIPLPGTQINLLFLLLRKSNPYVAVQLFLHFLVYVVLCLHIASNSFAKSRVVNQSLFEYPLRARYEPYQSLF